MKTYTLEANDGTVWGRKFSLEEAAQIILTYKNHNYLITIARDADGNEIEDGGDKLYNLHIFEVGPNNYEGPRYLMGTAYAPNMETAHRRLFLHTIRMAPVWGGGRPVAFDDVKYWGPEIAAKP